MKKQFSCNRADVLERLEKRIEEGKRQQAIAKRYWSRWAGFPMDDVYAELSIFDWWVDNLSVTKMKQMRDFLIAAGKLGYNGYVCFKVGATYCSHGMWAHKAESTDGYSPDGECLYHSFRPGDNYWDCLLPDGVWMHQKETDDSHDHEYSLREVKDALLAYYANN